MENLISIEIAEKEWSEFLTDNDAQSLIPNRDLVNMKDKDEKDEFEAKKNSFDRMVKAISKGFLVIENGVISQKLAYPVVSSDGQKQLEKLVFNQRWTASDREKILTGLDTKNANEALVAQRRLCAKLTGVDFIILGKLDSKDLKITDSIVSVFFM